MTDLIVNHCWPEADDKLPPKVLTLLDSGEATDEMVLIQATNFSAVDAVTGLYTWDVLERTQPFQMDLWVQSEPERNSCRARLDDCLHAGTLFTLGAGDPVRDGVLLQLDPLVDDGWNGYVDYTFEGWDNHDTEDSIRRAEYRSTCNAISRFVLQVKATSPRLAQVFLHQQFNDGPYEDLPIRMTG
jgi:hypothetical protein